MENLVKIAKENKEAFAELYHLNVESVYNFLLVRCGSREQAEDLTSDTWEIVVKKLRDLRSNNLIVFKAWLFKIAKNLIKKQWFKNSITIVSYEEFLDNREETETIEEGFSREELKKIWKKADKLPKKQREVVLLRFASDLKNKEIAKIMWLSEKTIASHLSRALSKLREDSEYLQ
jgi:RNA polymerase sigma-70 factor (ECF subfamily)